jgi:hypothetical protein
MIKYCIQPGVPDFYAILYQALKMDQQKLVSLFSRQPCWMIKPLATAIGYSIPSVRRFLTEAGYYSSFSHNGKWYTLHTIPHFDQDGIWFSDDIGFSSTGSLTGTIVNLINHSPTGMTAKQVGEKLQCRCHSVLIQLYRQGKLQRQKQGRSYIYLAEEAATQAIQLQGLEKKNAPVCQLPAEIAVLILVEFIRNPNLSLKQLATMITRHRHITVETIQIEELFALHGLKKTIRPVAPKH